MKTQVSQTLAASGADTFRVVLCPLLFLGIGRQPGPMVDDVQDLLERAYAELEAELTAPLQRWFRAVRAPELKWVRISVGGACIAGGCLSFLPVLGLELFPIGFLLLAHDTPWLREPVARAVLWALDVWRSFRAWWSAQRAQRFA